MIYLLCSFQPSVIKKYVREALQNSSFVNYLNYLNYSNSEKLNFIEELKLVYQKSAIPSFSRSSQKFLQAYYAISLLIAQKPFTKTFLWKTVLLKQ